MKVPDIENLVEDLDDFTNDSLKKYMERKLDIIINQYYFETERVHSNSIKLLENIAEKAGEAYTKEVSHTLKTLLSNKIKDYDEGKYKPAECALPPEWMGI